MIMDKNELAKIAIINKILLSRLSDEEINELVASVVISKKESHIVVWDTRVKIQMELKLQQITATTEFAVAFKDLVTLTKEFTKKANIDVIIENDTVTFNAMQGKEEKEVVIKMLDEKTRSYTKCNTSKIDTSDLLIAVTAVSKIMKDIPQIQSDALLELVETHHKLSMYAYTDIELFSSSHITDNESRSSRVFLDKDEVKFLLEIMKNLKSLEIDFALSNNGFVVSANGIDVLVIAKKKDSDISVSNLIAKVNQNSNYLPLKFNGIELDDELQKDYLRIEKKDDSYILTNRPVNTKNEYSYRINKIFNIKAIDVDILLFEKDSKILKIEFDNSSYYLMPKSVKE